jgi:hypothetical protein
MGRVIIIRDDGKGDYPTDHSYEADCVRANDRINKTLGINLFGRKKSRRD